MSNHLNKAVNNMKINALVIKKTAYKNISVINSISEFMLLHFKLQ